MGINENEILASIGLKIKAAREAKGLTLRDLEADTGIDNSDISKIERGLKRVEFTTVYRLAVALDIPFSELKI